MAINQVDLHEVVPVSVGTGVYYFIKVMINIITFSFVYLLVHKEFVR